MIQTSAAGHPVGCFQTGRVYKVCRRAPCAVQVVGVLKKEVMKTQSRDLEKGTEYRQLLVQASADSTTRSCSALLNRVTSVCALVSMEGQGGARCLCLSVLT